MMELGLVVWLLVLLSPAVVGIPYELWALFSGKQPVLTDVARRFVERYPGPSFCVALVYGFFCGTLVGHLFL